MDIINEVIMREMFDAEWVYESPEVLVIELKSEGVLCFSNEIPDWEENEDILYKNSYLRSRSVSCVSDAYT
jgi:hypothetical protein